MTVIPLNEPTRCPTGLRVAVKKGMGSTTYQQHVHFCERCEAWHDYILSLSRTNRYYTPEMDEAFKQEGCE
jgi:hypothetical protein